MNEKIKLTETEQEELRALFKSHLTNEKVILFGSRIKGNCHEHSDLDVAIKGDTKLAWNLIGELRDAFENSTFSFRIDFLDYHQVSIEFQKIIDNQGIDFNY